MGAIHDAVRPAIKSMHGHEDRELNAVLFDLKEATPADVGVSSKFHFPYTTACDVLCNMSGTAVTPLDMLLGLHDIFDSITQVFVLMLS